MSFADWVQNYVPTILYSVLVAVAGFLGACAKRIWERISADQTKKEVAQTVVRAVEQMHKELHGEEKKEEAIKGIREMLDAKGIQIADIEIEMLLEAAVAEFNAQMTKETAHD